MNSSSHKDDTNLRLIPREEGFSQPEKLKRSEMDGLDASRWEELCIAVAEDDINGPQKIGSLLSDNEFKQEVSSYKTLKLKADKQTSYPQKSLLKKSNIRVGLWIGVAAAIALLIAIPLIMQKAPSGDVIPQIAATPADTDKLPQEDFSSKAEEVQNSTRLAQSNSIGAKPASKAEAKAAVQHSNQDINTEPEKTVQEIKRKSLGLKTLEPDLSVTLAVNTEETIKPHIQTINKDVILLASGNEAERIEVERPSFLDKLKEKSIVSLNKLRGEGTMVVREYNSEGKLTLYAVQSNTLSFEKSYTE